MPAASRGYRSTRLLSLVTFTVACAVFAVLYGSPACGQNRELGNRQDLKNKTAAELNEDLGFRNLDLGNAFDRAVRNEGDIIDRSFMRWTFPTKVRWNEKEGSYTTPQTEVSLNRRQLERISATIPVNKRWLAYSLCLAHEKAHMIQFRVYGEDKAYRVPTKVFEAQADIMAGGYLWLRLSRQLINQERPDENPETILKNEGADPQKYQKAVIGDLDLVRQIARNSAELIQTSYKGYPSQAEREECITRGILAGLTMSQLRFGQVTETEMRSKLKMRASEDFLGWALRMAYEITGTPEGSGSTGAESLALSKAPLAGALRTALKEAEAGFRRWRGKFNGAMGDVKNYESTVEIPQSNGTWIFVDTDHAWLSAIMFDDPSNPSARAAWENLVGKLDEYLEEGWTRRESGPVGESKREMVTYRLKDGDRMIRVFLSMVGSRWRVSLMVQ